MEERMLRLECDVARLQSDVVHLSTHMADVKAELRSLRDKMDAMNVRFCGKLWERSAPPGLRGRG